MTAPRPALRLEKNIPGDVHRRWTGGSAPAAPSAFEYAWFVHAMCMPRAPSITR